MYHTKNKMIFQNRVDCIMKYDLKLYLGALFLVSYVNFKIIDMIGTPI